MDRVRHDFFGVDRRDRSNRDANMTGWKRLVLLLTFMVAVMMVALPAGYFHLQSVRQERVSDQATTFKLLCDRQEVETVRLIDTKRRLIGSDKRLRALVTAVVAPDRPPPSDRKLARRFRQEIKNLDSSIMQLKAGIRILERELKSVDCNNLPSDTKFKL